MHDRIINNGQIHAAIFMNNTIMQTLHGSPGDGAIAGLEFQSQFVGVLCDLDESEQASTSFSSNSSRDKPSVCSQINARSAIIFLR